MVAMKYTPDLESGRFAAAPALADLVIEVACNPAFAQWLFTNPAEALDAVRRNPSGALGPGLPGPEFAVPAIDLSDADCRAVLSLGARSLPELAAGVLAWERGRDDQAADRDHAAVLAAAS